MKKGSFELLNNEKQDKYKYILKVLGTTIGVYLMFKYIFPLIVPFVLAYLLSSCILPIAKWCENKYKIPRTLVGGILLLTIILILSTIVVFVMKTLIQQSMELLTNIPVYQQYFVNIMDSVCKNCDSMLGLVQGETKIYMDENMNSLLLGVQNKLIGRIQTWTIQFIQLSFGFISGMIFLIVSILLMVQDSDKINASFKKNKLYNEIYPMKCKIYEAGGAYLKAQLVIMSIIAIINATGLSLLKNPYGLLIGLAIGLIDSLPVLGSGTILIPWAIISLFTKNIYYAAVLMILYLFSQMTRQILEPSLIGNRLGIIPIFTIMSIYIGFELYGILGFILGPLSLITIRTIIENFQD